MLKKCDFYQISFSVVCLFIFSSLDFIYIVKSHIHVNLHCPGHPHAASGRGPKLLTGGSLLHANPVLPVLCQQSLLTFHILTSRHLCSSSVLGQAEQKCCTACKLVLCNRAWHFDSLPGRCFALGCHCPASHSRIKFNTHYEPPVHVPSSLVIAGNYTLSG